MFVLSLSLSLSLSQSVYVNIIHIYSAILKSKSETMTCSLCIINQGIGIAWNSYGDSDGRQKQVRPEISESYVHKWWKPSGKLFMQFSRVPIIFWGILGSPVPYRHPMHVVVGRPIEVKKNSNPTMEEVNELHGRFVEAFEDLFERHKARVGYEDLQLKIC
ncbi:Diacylglycerol O-acyltransferase 2 [Sarracenia purpurea var. burkii]